MSHIAHRETWKPVASKKKVIGQQRCWIRSGRLFLEHVKFSRKWIHLLWGLRVYQTINITVQEPKSFVKVQHGRRSLLRPLCANSSYTARFVLNNLPRSVPLLVLIHLNVTIIFLAAHELRSISRTEHWSDGATRQWYPFSKADKERIFLEELVFLRKEHARMCAVTKKITRKLIILQVKSIFKVSAQCNAQS